jgi:hypothetical protein
VIFDVFLAGFTKEMPPVALNESDLSELPDPLRAGGDIDIIRRSVELVLQALIEAEATEVSGTPNVLRAELRAGPAVTGPPPTAGPASPQLVPRVTFTG